MATDIGPALAENGSVADREGLELLEYVLAWDSVEVEVLNAGETGLLGSSYAEEVSTSGGATFLYLADVSKNEEVRRPC